GGEEVPRVAEPRRDRAGRDDRAERVPVAHGLGHGDHVRHHALLLEAPEPVAQATVADLDLVRDGEPAVPPDLGVDRGQVAVGKRHAAGVAVERLGQERRGRTAGRCQAGDRPHRVGGVPAGRYAADAVRAIAGLAAAGRPPAAFLAEPFYGNAGGMPLPDGYLAAVYAEVRRHGGLAIADEVQVGYGRLGHWFWGFEQQGVVPDV